MELAHKYADPIDYITCSQAAKISPGKPSGPTVWRWTTGGTGIPGGGRIYLKSVRAGGKIFTTREWLEEFLTAGSEAHKRVNSPETGPAVRTEKITPQHARRIADAKLEVMGVGK